MAAEKYSSFNDGRNAAGIGGGSFTSTELERATTIREDRGKTTQFDSLFFKDDNKPAEDILKEIIPDGLMTRGRKREAISNRRAVLRFGALGTLGVSIEKSDPKQDKSPDTLRGKLVLSSELPNGQPTTHPLEGATITRSADGTNLKFPTHTATDGTFSATTEVTINTHGIDKKVTYTPGEGRKVRVPDAEALPESGRFPSEVPDGKASTYSFDGAVARKTEAGLEVVLPAVDHLTSQTVTTIEYTPDGVIKTVKILPLETVFKKQPDGKEIIREDLDENAVTAMELQRRQAQDAAQQLAPASEILVPSLRSEGEGEIAREAAKAAEKEAAARAAIYVEQLDTKTASAA